MDENIAEIWLWSHLVSLLKSPVNEGQSSALNFLHEDPELPCLFRAKAHDRKPQALVRTLKIVIAVVVTTTNTTTTTTKKPNFNECTNSNYLEQINETFRIFRREVAPL
jgi:hypothetical protein